MLKVERKSRIGSMEITQMVEVDSLTKDEEIAYLKRDSQH